MGKVVGGLIAATALLGVAGCGGGSSSDDFVSEANEICKRANAKINGIAQPTSDAEIKGFLDRVEPVIEGALGQLQDVTPPGDKESAYNEWLATLRKQEVLIGQATAAADSGNTTRATTLVRQQAGLDGKGNRQAAALGLNECSNVDSGSSG
jgi:hypothetical protein